MNPTHSARDITLKLLAIQEHIKKKLTFKLGNLLAVAGWHVVAELLHVSCRPELCVSYRILNESSSTISCTGRQLALAGSFPNMSTPWPSTFGRPRIGSATARLGLAVRHKLLHRRPPAMVNQRWTGQEATTKKCHPRQVFPARRFMPRTSKTLSWTRVHGLRRPGYAKAGGFSLE